MYFQKRKKFQNILLIFKVQLCLRPKTISCSHLYVEYILNLMDFIFSRFFTLLGIGAQLIEIEISLELGRLAV